MSDQDYLWCPLSRRSYAPHYTISYPNQILYYQQLQQQQAERVSLTDILAGKGRILMFFVGKHLQNKST